MKWLLWIIVIVIIVAGGWYLLSGANPGSGQAPATTATTTTSDEIIPGVQNETYTNQHLSFSIEYPATANTTTDFSEGYLPLTQTPVIAIELPQSMFAGTNLSEAGVYIGATTTPSVMTACTEASQQAEETATTSLTIGGQTFFAFTSTGVGAGNIYQEKTFRTFQNGSCFEIVELLHSGNIGNYTPGTVQQFDEAEFSGILDSIVQTYYPIPTGQ
jgi:hypothetical protein